MIIAYLVLAHLVADFMLQPSKLVKWKMADPMGSLVHVLVHFFTMNLVLLPLILRGNYWLLVVSAIIATIHFVIDELKINYDIKHDEKVLPFILDQILHLLVILSVYAFMIKNVILLPLPANFWTKLYSNIDLFNFLSYLVFVSFVLEVYRFEQKREKHKNVAFKVHKKQMFLRILSFSGVYLVFVAIWTWASQHGLS